MKRKITDKQVELLRKLYLDGVPIVEIGRQVGCTFQNVSRIALGLGLPSRQQITGAMPQRAMVDAYRSGMSSDAIGRSIGAHGSTVREVLRANGVKIRNRQEQVVDMRAQCVRMFRSGMFYREIAAHLGLTTHQVKKRVQSVLGAGSQADGALRRSARGYRPSGKKGVKATLVRRSATA